MISSRLVSSLLLLLTPQLALAAPAADNPPVQRPTQQPSEQQTTGEQSERSEQPSDDSEAQSVAEGTGPADADGGEPAGADAAPSADASDAADPTTPVADDAASDPSADAEVGAPTEPAAEAPGETDPAAESGEDLSHLLDSDEADDGPRVRVASSTPDRVDRSERLRNYYASIYRPKHNPARVYFAARGAIALAGTTDRVGGGRMGFANVEVGQTWNFIGYGLNAALYAGGLTFGDTGVEQFSPVAVGGGPSIGLGRLSLLGRGYLDLRAGYNFFYAPVAATREGMADPPDAAPHGPKLQLDAGLLFHGSESRRFRHGIGVSVGWQLMVHSLAGEFPLVNTFNVGVGYFFG